MLRIKLLFKQGSVIALSLLLMGAFPASALADTGTPDPSAPDPSQTQPADNSASTTTPTPPAQGPTSPPGPAANTYTFNTATGLWENQYYTWNPATGQTTPKITPTYSFNPATGHWDTTNWAYSPASGTYVPNVVEVATPPAGADIASSQSIANTGPDSTNNNTSASSNNGIFNGFYNATISNNLTSNALSGNALVSGNTYGGNATSGDASAIANIINILQSSGGILQGGNINTFTANINGNVQGDLTLDPSSITNTGPLSVNNNNSSQNTDITVNEQANGTINNNIDLAAQTGDAGVTGNTTGGNATSGDATVEANIINLINAVVGAGQGFLGVININGNLNGDILLPQDTLNSLIAASGPYATVDTSQITDNNLKADFTNNQNITNNLNSDASTGNADVSHNTTGGNATTGAASTKVNVLNLTGNTVIGKDALLVFVNVMGNWVGMIVNAPAGSTAAALGGNTTNTGPNSTNKTTLASNTNTDITATSNETINNNINGRANSGNATVSGNTKGGNASTGNATVAANILNCEGCTLSLTDWLGILFINVFGTWNGSFGVNTAAGNPAQGGMGGGSGSTSAVDDVKVFQLSSGGNGDLHINSVNKSVLDAFAGGSATNTNHKTAVLGLTNKTPSGPQAVNAKSGTFPVVMLGAGLLGFTWIIGSTPQIRRGVKNYGSPVVRTLQTASTRLFTFLF